MFKAIEEIDMVCSQFEPLGNSKSRQTHR